MGNMWAGFSMTMEKINMSWLGMAATECILWHLYYVSKHVYQMNQSINT